MFLRQLFESSQTSIGLVFGRFNPPHKGHRAAWEMASKATYWYVGTNKSTQGPKDPLPYDVKVEAMTTIWPEVADHIMPEQSWLTLASHCYAAHKDATVLVCFTDEEWVTKTVQQYNGKEGPHGFYNFKVIKQQATPRLSSATALRDAVVNDNREAFGQAAGVPADTQVAGQSFFDLVAQYLLPYANAPKKVSKKKAVQEPAEAMLPKSAFAGSSKNKLGYAGQWKNTGPSKNRPAKAGDLVGGAAEGVAEDDVDDFIKAGGKVQYGKSQKGPRRPGLSFGSKHIGVAGGGGKASQISGRGANTGKGSKPVVAVERGIPVSENVEKIMSILIERLKNK